MKTREGHRGAPSRPQPVDRTARLASSTRQSTEPVAVLPLVCQNHNRRGYKSEVETHGDQMNREAMEVASPPSPMVYHPRRAAGWYQNFVQS